MDDVWSSEDKLETVFRGQDVGTAATDDAKEAWRSLAEQWVAKEFANKPVLPQDQTVKKTKLYRLATKHHLAAIDYVLRSVTGEGLAKFIPPARLLQLEEAIQSQILLSTPPALFGRCFCSFI